MSDWMNDPATLFLTEIMVELPRQGPGSEATTRHALSLIELPEKARVLDVGCGTGGQTIVLAQNTTAHVTGLDIFPAFLNKLKNNAHSQNVSNRISCVRASMVSPPFAPQTFDLIWAEGSVYSVGFENALKILSKFVKPDGYMAWSEVVWTRDDAPEELRDFWQKEYPDLSFAAEREQQIVQAGLEVVNGFNLPEEDWDIAFYRPMHKWLAELAIRYTGDELRQKIIMEMKNEIEFYQKYSDYYSYRFFIMRKP